MMTVLRQRLPVAALGLALLVAVRLGVNAGQERTSDEDITQMAKPLDHYLGSIRTAYPAVDALILKPGNADYGDVLDRLSRARDKAENAMDRPFYSYLLARTHYWRAYHRFKNTRDRKVFEEARTTVISEHLRAFSDLNEPAFEDPALAGFRETVVTALVDLLAAYSAPQD
jgi:hypothetical protein